MAEKLVRVVAPHFVAGLVFREGKCVRAAPILGYLIGKSENAARFYLRSKPWKVSIVAPRVFNPTEGF